MKYRKGVVLPLSRNCFSIALLFLVCNTPGAYPQAVIIDHTCTDLSLIPVEYINNARGQFRVGYGHTSHGSQITTGMELINSPPYYFNGDGAGGALSYQEYDGDLGSWGDTSWASATRSLLNSGSDRNVIIWSWCGGVTDNNTAGISAYLNAMNQIEADYPNVKFVYMTGHLDGTGTGGGLNVLNNQIRSYCIVNNKVLFDFADIESYDPNGTDYLNLGGGTGEDGDGCQYNSGNWGIEWCAAHAGSELCAECDCAHSQPLNCNLKGRAFWWMMARLAGWQGTSPGPTPTPPPPVAPPITLHTNKTAFPTSDTIVITANVRATANFTPYIRFALPGGSSLYLIRGGRVARGAQPFMKGPLTLGADIAGYGVAQIVFSGIAPGSYALQGALVWSGGIIDGINETAVTVE